MKVIETLVKAAEASDRTLAQTALHTLGSLQVGDDTAKRLEKIALHADFDRGRFVLELLGRMGGAEAARVLTKTLVATGDRRYAEAAANGLAGKEEAVPALAKALLETTNPDRAWVLRNVLRPTAKKIAPALRKQILEEALSRLGNGERGTTRRISTSRAMPIRMASPRPSAPSRPSSGRKTRTSRASFSRSSASPTARATRIATCWPRSSS